jgi:hypothetical protein
MVHNILNIEERTIFMKSLGFNVFLILIFLLAATGIKAQSEPSPFAGNWMLDREKTYTTPADFPERLKNFKMAVTGDAAIINVKSQVEGNVEVRAAGNGSITPVTESASRMGTSTASGVQSSANTGKVSYGGTMALFFTVNNATYNLNGEEVKIETNQGLVRVKAKSDKSGKSLQFTTFRRMKTPKGEMEVTIREVWKLSEDGKSLKLQRTVETPTTRDEINMILSRV